MPGLSLKAAVSTRRITRAPAPQKRQNLKKVGISPHHAEDAPATGKEMKKYIFIWAPSVVWAFLILVLSVSPSGHYPKFALWYADKIVHAGMYAIFSFLVFRSFSHHPEIPFYAKRGLFTLILCSVYGILFELVQRFVPGREPELGDAAANILGIILGILIGRKIRWLR